MQKEIFRDIPNYEGIYQVSNLGRVKSLKFSKERILKPSINSNGYYHLVLCSGNCKTKTIHNLIAICFLNHKPEISGLVVDHINFNRLDNRLNNLRVITQRENTNLKHMKSVSEFTGVDFNKKSMKWRSRILVNGKRIFLGYFNSEKEASESYNKICH